MSNPPAEALTPPIEGSFEHYFAAEAAGHCAREITEAGGVEVFFIGRRDQTGLVAEVESHAYGTDDCVPALTAFAQPGDVIIHNHPGGGLMPSNADLGIASSMGNLGVGCYIIDNACRRCRVVVRPQEPKKRVVVKDDEVLKPLSGGGKLSHVVAQYEDRPQQREMAAAVLQALNHDGIAVVEAGTGTGKSFAYLLPSILYGLKNGDRVVVSTNTINLQEQLLHKDIPELERALGEEIEVELVKGRNNYVCKRKAQYARAEAQTLLEDDFIRELKDVLEWAKESSTGDRQDLPITPRHDVWERVQSEADNCLRVRCPFYEECFFYNSRRRAARAKLLIVNHSLLMADLAVRRASGNYTMAAVLPPYKRVILDEAHHLEEAATKNLAQQITRPGLRTMMGRLYRKDSKQGHGVLQSLADELGTVVQKGLMEASDDLIQRVMFDLMPRVADVRDSLDFLFQDFADQFIRIAGVNSRAPRLDEKIRLVPRIWNNPAWQDECHEILATMASELAKFLDLNRVVLEGLWERDEKVTNALVNPLMEWQAYIGRLDNLRRMLLSFLQEDRKTCKWVELWKRPTDQKAIHVRLCSAPVDVRELLRESLHDKMKSEVLTSATLTVDHRFDFFRERTGLPEIKPEEQVEYDEEGLPIVDVSPASARPVSMDALTTPFDYKNQVYFAVPTDLSDPRDGNFDDQFADLVNRAVAASGGRAFVLFTSYGQLNRVYTLCEPTLRRLGIDALRQGSASRDRLLRQFREDETSVLFATSSFWEGVDVKGRSLELLILARLPFAVPSDPIQEAQFEALKAQGRDPFDQLVVPRAVIRFKQGFGRLIRSRTDRGAVLIADKRVVQMRYGRRFLHSLPGLNVKKGETGVLLNEMEDFLRNRAELPEGV